MTTICRFAAILMACLLIFPDTGIFADEKLKVLIIDGQNNHDWRATTPILKSLLEKSG